MGKTLNGTLSIALALTSALTVGACAAKNQGDSGATAGKTEISDVKTIEYQGTLLSAYGQKVVIAGDNGDMEFETSEATLYKTGEEGQMYLDDIVAVTYHVDNGVNRADEIDLVEHMETPLEFAGVLVDSGNDHITLVDKNLSVTFQIDDDSYLTLLYGNMLHDNLTVPMILVNLDMYTDKLADKDDKSDEELRYIYDKVITEITTDLMPFIEATYPVSAEREDTAVAGMSEGGAKSLCIGFEHLDRFGWIASFAPDTGVIPTEYYKGTFWNTPYMDEFPQPTAENTPYYLYMTVGSKDPYNVDCTLYYRDVLDGMGVKNQTDLVEGYEHNPTFWRQCFYNFLTKVFHQ